MGTLQFSYRLFPVPDRKDLERRALDTSHLLRRHRCHRDHGKQELRNKTHKINRLRESRNAASNTENLSVDESWLSRRPLSTELDRELGLSRKPPSPEKTNRGSARRMRRTGVGTVRSRDQTWHPLINSGIEDQVAN